MALEITDDQRRANDVHRHWVPVVVLGFLLFVAYIWTDWVSFLAVVMRIHTARIGKGSEA